MPSKAAPFAAETKGMTSFCNTESASVGAAPTRDPRGTGIGRGVSFSSTGAMVSIGNSASGCEIANAEGYFTVALLLACWANAIAAVSAKTDAMKSLGNVRSIASSGGDWIRSDQGHPRPLLCIVWSCFACPALRSVRSGLVKRDHAQYTNEVQSRIHQREAITQIRWPSNVGISIRTCRRGLWEGN